MASKKRNWTWKDDSPGAIVFVLIVLAIAILFPHDTCRPNSDVEPDVTVSADSDDTHDHGH